MIEDPYNYRHCDWLSIPKYLVNASGDQFFLPDNSQFYFPNLQGEKYLRYAPNAKHDVAGRDARESMLAYYQAWGSGRRVKDCRMHVDQNMFRVRCQRFVIF